MADIEFNCPSCNLVLAAPEDMAGQLVECPECNNQMTVPGEAAPAAPAEDAGAEACPECGQAMPEGSVLCMGCGFHIELGKKITTDFQ
jgi:predicted RNA-binding Zn-ribbon protein involved in translation (DUF1610 family)